MLNERVEGTVVVIGRAAKLGAGGPFSENLLFERLHQPGLANAGLSAEQDHLAFTRLGLLPAAVQQPQLLFSSY